MVQKKIGAILAGIAMIGSALVVSAANQLPHSFWVNEDGTPAAMIVVGDGAAASDIVSASLIAVKMGAMAVKVEKMQAPSTIYSDSATNIPLAYSIPSWEATIPEMIYNVPGTPYDDAVLYYKTWGVTTHWTPSKEAYGDFITFDDVRVEYTLGSLWFYDEDSRTWFFTHPDGTFQAWETHEEIQIRFDDLYLVGGKEYQLSGLPFQDHNADLAGGDVVPEMYWEQPGLPAPDIPGLIYRIDNIRRPVQAEIAGYSLSFPSDDAAWVDTHAEASNYYYIPSPHAIHQRMIPRIIFFGKEYKVADATFLWDFDMRYGTQEEGWKLGDDYVIVTGEPRFYQEQYAYADSPVNFDGHEVWVKDVDRDHNKALLAITNPSGDTYEFWMVLDPMHGFSATPQLMSQTGEATEYDGWSYKDVFFWTHQIRYRDESGHAHFQYDYPVFALDGISTFIGADGTIGALFNAYTLSDVVEFKSRPCCLPYMREPYAYSLFLDQQMTLDPCVGNYFNPSLIDQWADAGDIPSGIGLLGDDIPGTAFAIPYMGPWNSMDSHCTTSSAPLPPGASHGDAYTYTHFVESLPDDYADRDPNDYLWLYEDGFRARKNSHMWIPGREFESPGQEPSPSPVPGGDYPLRDIIGNLGADYMWEMNLALCDTIESVKCATKWVIYGPSDYFRIEMDDISWDDNANGWPYLNTGTEATPAWEADGADDGVDFRVLMGGFSSSYIQTTRVTLDPTLMIRLDTEVTDGEKMAFNLILIGGPAANTLVRRLIESDRQPDDGSDREWMTVYGDFKFYTNGFFEGRDVLVVAGPDREETRKAAEELVAGMG